jgi:Ser/Thr protein kinase RdoA (MazF antagonist)
MRESGENIQNCVQELAVPEPVPNLSGELKSLEAIGGGRHIVRLLKFVPGKEGIRYSALKLAGHLFVLSSIAFGHLKQTIFPS